MCINHESVDRSFAATFMERQLTARPRFGRARGGYSLHNVWITSGVVTCRDDVENEPARILMELLWYMKIIWTVYKLLHEKRR